MIETMQNAVSNVGCPFFIPNLNLLAKSTLYQRLKVSSKLLIKADHTAEAKLRHLAGWC